MKFYLPKTSGNVRGMLCFTILSKSKQESERDTCFAILLAKNPSVNASGVLSFSVLIAKSHAIMREWCIFWGPNLYSQAPRKGLPEVPAAGSRKPVVYKNNME